VFLKKRKQRLVSVFDYRPEVTDYFSAEAPLRHGGRKDRKKKWETTSSQDVQQLTDAEVANHTIFDVVMPLPGFDVEYPSGHIGELYLQIMRADGLDPHRMRREQRSVVFKILHCAI